MVVGTVVVVVAAIVGSGAAVEGVTDVESADRLPLAHPTMTTARATAVTAWRGSVTVRV